MEGNKGFIVDVEIFICFDFDGNFICIFINNGFYFLKS